MKITNNQIEDLYQFTRKHFVYHYDVQTELVDHLANDIEEIWLENPQLTFEQARDQSFKKFGIFGFMDVIEAKQKQMNKRYQKIMWRFVKEWFTIPKVITTTLIFLSIFSVLKIRHSEYVLLGTLFILAIFDLINLSKLRKNQKKKEEKLEKVFLLEAMIEQTRNGFTGLTFINLFNFVNLTKASFSDLENYWLVLISFSATLIFILFYVTGYVIPQKAEELLQETYPEYKLVKNL
ncbi:MAG: hypothetical protein GW772_08780 [Flavobacteriia bacterium]|nr:hypothetical protein [Flavobacteriia bacterium]OIP47695.1 MAG: hypothetical protein AUK46_04110 [Flavobacteriaceae bacterium CG2_30_31_66]PIV97385.1 MAG: hypothetical protein COW43_03080 [Flavobacteriaceae bacterium CG17_big_fil_post_rev_8_21_14_2_50_31_13]PIX14219.1 MAG: hypothetical protein COZ74_03520 [Flavobacteriaceae bacterium CG_4_8_14_3_um_filter_31_8]PIY14743.1 MAG: hypothetical protein COZ16_07320 [Flavobacteriaceae bacterium CG_4_10_14_3_um_filter_31_253]PIZ12092.1 MAG: hypotheti